MPTYANRRGRRRVRAAATVQGKVKTKWWPDDSKKSYREAATWEEAIKKEQARQEKDNHQQIPTVSYPTVHEWLTQYLDYIESRVAKKTYKEKKDAAKRLLAYIPPDTPTNRLTFNRAMQFLTEQGRTRSGYSANKARKNLAVAWKWACKFLPGFPAEAGNPFAAVDKLPEQRKPRYVPPEEDFWAVLDVTEGQDRVMLIAALHLALRKSELFGLTWEDLDFASGVVRVWTSKRRGSNREYDWLPMTRELKRELLWWWENRPMKRTVYVFTQLYKSPSRWHEPGKPFIKRHHWMKELCALAGVKHFGLHGIRHLSATILFKAGYPLAVIQRILRHKSPTTTERYLQRLGLTDLKIDDEVFARKEKGKVIAINQ
ncbi:MAG: site-specific integrase [Desulfobacteraceae bacterium]|nr:site-specific integrase [Desulfobacteraceae bacterium]